MSNTETVEGTDQIKSDYHAQTSTPPTKGIKSMPNPNSKWNVNKTGDHRKTSLVNLTRETLKSNTPGTYGWDYMMDCLSKLLPSIELLNVYRGRYSDQENKVPARAADVRVHEVIDLVNELQNEFKKYPAFIRSVFRNDPALYAHFCVYPGNSMAEVAEGLMSGDMAKYEAGKLTPLEEAIKKHKEGAAADPNPTPETQASEK